MFDITFGFKVISASVVSLIISLMTFIKGANN